MWDDRNKFVPCSGKEGKHPQMKPINDNKRREIIMSKTSQEKDEVNKASLGKTLPTR